MSKETGVIVLGMWVFLVPFLGVPGSWKTVLLVLSGLGIAVIGFLLRTEAVTNGTHAHDSFTDSAHAAPAHETAVGEEVR